MTPQNSGSRSSGKGPAGKGAGRGPAAKGSAGKSGAGKSATGKSVPGKAGRASGKGAAKADGRTFAPGEAPRPTRSSPDVLDPRAHSLAEVAAEPRSRPKVTVQAGDRPWKAWIIAGGWLLAVWFALWGAVTPMLALTGVAVAVVALVLFPLPVVEFTFGLHPVRAIILVARFLLDVLVASVQVAWLAVRPRLPQSEITTVQLRSTSDLIQTLTSLAVSLVPGSLIIDADPDHRTLKIHVLDPGPGGLPKFHQSVLDQEERIVRALGGAVEIDAVMGVGEPDERAVHIGHISWGPAGLQDEQEELDAAPETHEQSDLVALDAELMASGESSGSSTDETGTNATDMNATDGPDASGAAAEEADR